MTVGLLLVAYFGGLNPARARLGLPETDKRARTAALAAGSLLSLGLVAALAGWSGPLLRSLEITPETFRIAAGIAAILGSALALLRPRPAAEPAPARWWAAAWWPVCFPLLVGPEVMALAVATGSQEGVAPTLGAAAAALLAGIALGRLPRGPVADGVLRWAARVLGLLLLVAGIWLAVDGIRDV